jgi:DNA-binding transcriptional MerR regulator
MGLNMKEKQAVTREYKDRYQKATKKEKQDILDQYTRLTGYHRKSAVRLLNAKPVKTVTLYVDGKAVKLKPGKKRPANRKGRRIYTDRDIDCLRLIWVFFCYKCGKILAPLMRTLMDDIKHWQDFGVTDETAEKLMKISPASIDRYLKKDKDALRLRGKSLTKPLDSLKSRIPIRTF